MPFVKGNVKTDAAAYWLRRLFQWLNQRLLERLQMPILAASEMS